MTMKEGDIVARRSYGCDLIFRVTRLNESSQTAELVGEDMRLIADAPFDDLGVNRFQ